MDEIQRELDDAKSKLSAQNRHIQQLLQDRTPHAQPSNAAPAKATHSNRIWSRKDQSQTTPTAVSARYLGDTIAFKNKRCSTVPYARSGNPEHSPTHTRAGLSRTPPASPTRKVAGGFIQDDDDVAVIIAALEKEGYRPDEVTSEGVIMHLWREKQQASAELKKAHVSSRLKTCGWV